VSNGRRVTKFPPPWRQGEGGRRGDYVYAKIPLSLTRIKKDLPKGEEIIKSTPILNTL